MNADILKYHIFPRVVRANHKQVITAIGLDESSQFYDDCEYFAQVHALDDYDVPQDILYPSKHVVPDIPCRCENGVVTFEYFFAGEQEWNIRIFRKENEKHQNPMYRFHKDSWKHLIDRPLNGVSVRIYSLEEDLHARRPLKGDLHIHTVLTDGDESPEMSAALYRKAGYDFIGITDHHTIEPSLQAIEKFREIPTCFRIYPGEEIHNGHDCYFHMVNFNCRRSVCEKIMEHRDLVEQEIDALEASMEVPEGLDRREMAWRKWLHEEIHKAGGISILPHPYSVIGGTYNVQTKVCEAVFSMGLCDVFEAVSGTKAVSERRKQAALYQQTCAKGIDLPIVGSSDCHTAVERGDGTFDISWTIVFARNVDTITEDILDKYAVAVDNLEEKNKFVYGSLRQVKYAWFLIENYYQFHDALCSDIGSAVLRRVFGDKTQDPLIRLLEAELEKFNKSFFGCA